MRIVRITPQDWKNDPKVSSKHDDLYARALECEDERPIFDNEYVYVVTPTLFNMAVRSDLADHETGITPGTSRQCSLDFSFNEWIIWRNRQVFPLETCWGIECGAIQPNSYQPVWNTIYVKIRSPAIMIVTDIRLFSDISVFHGTQTYTF